MNAHNQPIPCGSRQQQEALLAAESALDMYQVRDLVAACFLCLVAACFLCLVAACFLYLVAACFLCLVAACFLCWLAPAAGGHVGL